MLCSGNVILSSIGKFEQNFAPVVVHDGRNAGHAGLDHLTANLHLQLLQYSVSAKSTEVSYCFSSPWC